LVGWLELATGRRRHPLRRGVAATRTAASLFNRSVPAWNVFEYPSIPVAADVTRLILKNRKSEIGNKFEPPDIGGYEIHAIVRAGHFRRPGKQKKPPER